MIVAAAFGAGTAFFGPAFDAIVPQLVPSADLNQANSLDQFIRPAAARMIGPAIGGWLIARLGRPRHRVPDRRRHVRRLDRVRGAASGARAVDRRLGGTSTAFHDIREGFRFVRSRVWLWGTFLAATLAYLIFWGPSEVLLPFIVKNHMHGSASDLGFILALGGVGAMFAAIVMGNREMPRRHITFMYGVWTVSTLADRGLRAGVVPLAADGGELRLQRPGGRRHDRVGHHEGPAGARRGSSGGCPASTGSSRSGLVPVSFALTGPVAARLRRPDDAGGRRGARRAS